MITKPIVAQRIFEYLNHSISLSELVDWCEKVMMDGEIEEAGSEVITEVVARVGLADVNNFGLLWEDCEKLLDQLGYKLQVDMLKVA